MSVMTFSDLSLPSVLPEDAAPLVATVAGSVLLPGDTGYDDERAVWNLNHELVPAVIVVPESAADVQAAVTFAAGQHRPVLVKTTGHQIVGQAHGAVVIATQRMNDVAIDAVGRTARVGAGAIWSAVVEKAAKAGLAPLNGSNPTVGVAGYTLGGGLSPTLGRSHGYAADHVRSLDVVTADGELRHVDAESEPELFWALRGGKGNFGVGRRTTCCAKLSMKVCGRTSRRRMSAARSQTRNPPNPSARLPEQSGPGPADGQHLP